MGIEGFERNLSEETHSSRQRECPQQRHKRLLPPGASMSCTSRPSRQYQDFYPRHYEDPEAGEAPQTERAEEDEPGSASDVTGENAESEQEPPKPVESETTSKQEIRPVKQLAEEKLKKELAAAKDKSFADPIISYLLKRCEEDEGMAEDVAQEYKTWQKCFDYIYRQARQ